MVRIFASFASVLLPFQGLPTTALLCPLSLTEDQPGFFRKNSFASSAALLPG